MKNYLFSSFLLLILCAGCSDQAPETSFDENTYYRLSNMLMSDDMSLEVNPGALSIMMAPSGDNITQSWKITAVGNGLFQLSCQLMGEGKVIDIATDSISRRIVLADNTEYSSQIWRIEDAGNGYYRLINDEQPDKSFDVHGDENDNSVLLNPIGDSDGQFWIITEISAPEASAELLKIGAMDHGGIVFYLDESGQHGLVCQENDFVGMLSFSEANIACENSTADGKDDWRLPDLDELELMYNNLRLSGLTHFDQEWYWSSKVEDEHNMWSMDLLHGNTTAHWEGDHSHVRAVRSF